LNRVIVLFLVFNYQFVITGLHIALTTQQVVFCAWLLII
jgi:hypothetical protein